MAGLVVIVDAVVTVVEDAGSGAAAEYPLVSIPIITALEKVESRVSTLASSSVRNSARPKPNTSDWRSRSKHRTECGCRWGASSRSVRASPSPEPSTGDWRTQSKYRTTCSYRRSASSRCSRYPWTAIDRYNEQLRCDDPPGYNSPL